MCAVRSAASEGNGSTTPFAARELGVSLMRDDPQHRCEWRDDLAQIVAGSLQIHINAIEAVADLPAIAPEELFDPGGILRVNRTFELLAIGENSRGPGFGGGAQRGDQCLRSSQESSSSPMSWSTVASIRRNSRSIACQRS